MQYDIQFKILNNETQHNYLINHSNWYKYLNRDINNYKKFLNEFKVFKREKRVLKFNETLDTLDTVNTIFKVLK